MAAETGPPIRFRTPTIEPETATKPDLQGATIAEGSQNPQHGEQKASPRRYPLLRNRTLKTSPGAGDATADRLAAAHGIIRGSFTKTPTTPRRSVDARARASSPAPSPRAGSGAPQLEPLVREVDGDTEGYGLEESRDGFFDAAFARPLEREREGLMREGGESLPDALREKNRPVTTGGRFLTRRLREARACLRRIGTTGAGVRLLKTFLGVFVAYVVCLIPASRNWLGRYNYIMVVSAIVNHPGRAIGSQIDGAVLTVLGTVTGLAWGSLALYVSTSTATAQSGYGGILATFLAVFAVLIGWLRGGFIRLYQAVLCAGIAIVYTCLADTSQSVGWRKVFDYGIPWVLGQGVCLIVAVVVFPDAGSRSLA